MARLGGPLQQKPREQLGRVAKRLPRLGPEAVLEAVLSVRPLLSLHRLARRDEPGREKGDFFSPFEARISVSFHSFRLIFGREIISR